MIQQILRSKTTWLSTFSYVYFITKYYLIKFPFTSNRLPLNQIECKKNNKNSFTCTLQPSTPVPASLRGGPSWRCGSCWAWRWCWACYRRMMGSLPASCASPCRPAATGSWRWRQTCCLLKPSACLRAGCACLFVSKNCFLWTLRFFMIY